jgi:hypothetical protein
MPPPDTAKLLSQRHPGMPLPPELGFALVTINLGRHEQQQAGDDIELCGQGFLKTPVLLTAARLYVPAAFLLRSLPSSSMSCGDSSFDPVSFQPRAHV